MYYLKYTTCSIMVNFRKDIVSSIAGHMIYLDNYDFNFLLREQGKCYGRKNLKKMVVTR